MSLRVGDHLVIKRDGRIIPVEEEGYHEFEVIEQPEHFTPANPKYQFHAGYRIATEVVE